MTINSFKVQGERDLEERCVHLRHDHPAAAKTFLHELESRLELLAEYPQMGGWRVDLEFDCRSLPVGSYVLFYRADQESVVVLRVLHAARDGLALL